MTISYWLYGEDFKRHSDALDKEQAVQLEIMDQQDKLWKPARIMIFRAPVEGAVPVGLLGSFGEPFSEGQYHIKILEELSSSDAD